MVLGMRSIASFRLNLDGVEEPLHIHMALISSIMAPPHHQPLDELKATGVCVVDIITPTITINTEPANAPLRR